MEQRIRCLAAKACPPLALPCAGLETVRVPTLPAATHEFCRHAPENSQIRAAG